MIVRRSINKDELKELPKTVFPGRIHVIQSEAETEKAVAYLQSQPILGIDSETRPSFTKGQSHKVALLQISSNECCFLFRLNMTGLTQPLVDLLENPAVIKVGLSLKDDFMMLHKRAPFTQQSCIELQDYVRQFGIQDKSLQKIYAILFKEKISKSQRLSNWEADVLSDGQKQYAATDAWACLNIYNLLQELKRTGNYEVESLPVEEEVDARIRALGEQISKDYEGKQIHLICVLKGGVFFMCELAKRITVPVSMDFMCVGSYGDGTKSSGVVRIAKDLDESIEGKDVLIVEDIIDSGNTLYYLMDVLQRRKPASLHLCTLLDKPDRRVNDVKVDYTGFEIPDEFVVGYGLDYAQKYRNLPYIGVVEGVE